MKPRVLSIVVTFNGSKWVKNCISSLLKSKLQTDIFVIDNNSTDNTVALIDINFPHVKIAKMQSNLGFGKANNVGLKHALNNSYDFVFLLNQDAWISEDTIENLVNTSRANTEYGVLSPVHSNGVGDRLDLNFAFYITEQKCPYLFSHVLMGNKLNEIYPLDFVNAAAWLITADCLKAIGGFDPLFYHYGEDNNYAQRVLYHGLKIGICPQTKIFHDRPQDASGVSKFIALDSFDKEMKVLIADVNNVEFEKVYKSALIKMRRKIVSSLTSAAWSKFTLLNGLLNHLKSIKPILEKSYKENRKRGPSHLS